MEPEGDYSSSSLGSGFKSWLSRKNGSARSPPESPRPPPESRLLAGLFVPHSPVGEHQKAPLAWPGHDNDSSDDDSERPSDEESPGQQETYQGDIVVSDEPLENSFLTLDHQDRSDHQHDGADNEALREQRQQEQQDYELARQLMDESARAAPESSALLPIPNTITGKAVAFVHELRNAIENENQLGDARNDEQGQRQDPQTRMVSMVHGNLIQPTTERLLKFQQMIMQKNDQLMQRANLIQRVNQYTQYNSDIEASDSDDPENDLDRSQNDDHQGATEDDEAIHPQETAPQPDGSVTQLLQEAAAKAQTVEEIDICYGVSDATGTIVKLPSPASFGKGIYTSNTPFSPIFSNYDPKQPKQKLLLMARIKGKIEHVHGTRPQSENTIKGQADSAIVVTPGTADEICILRRSSQCVPLFVVRPYEPGSGRPKLDGNDDQAIGNDIIHRHVCQLQRLVDEILHDKDRHTPSIPQRVLPSEVRGIADPSSISSFQVANRTLPLSMKSWSLSTVVYYSSPDTIDDRAFCFPTKDKLEHYLAHELPSGTKDHGDKKCALCGTRGNLITLPKCRHPFQIPCLVRRWSKGTFKSNCPTCNVPIGYRQTAAITSAEKDPAIILNFQIADEVSLGDTVEPRKSHSHCQAPTSVLTVIVPIFDDKVSPMSPANALTIRYECGSTFQLKLAAPPVRRTIRTAEQWDLNFSDAQFLLQVQKRVTAHNAKCTICQRRLERPSKAGLFRYIVPNHSAGNSKDGDPKIFIGTMPSGSMRVDDIQDLTCSGHPPGVFSIKYWLDAGVQKSYHDHPGEAFKAIHREAYLPKSAAGRELLERLIIAFTYGLTFIVGASVTKKASNAIKWSSIPHKTSLSPGTFGYPDAAYFQAAHAELDALGVPRVNGAALNESS